MTQLVSEDTPQQIISRLFSRAISIFVAIMGRRESGKTHLAFLICEILYEAGIIKNFATNVRLIDSPIPFTFIDNLDDLRYWAENTKGKKLFVFDEFGKVFRRRTPMSKINVDLMDDLQILRKHKLSIIAIFPAEKYVDSTTFGSDILDAMFIKPNKPNPKDSQKIALYVDLLRQIRKTFVNLPNTTIKFDTWDTAKFKRHGEKKKPPISDNDRSLLWDWAHGKTCKELNIFPMQLNRISRKFVKEMLEREYNT